MKRNCEIMQKKRLQRKVSDELHTIQRRNFEELLAFCKSGHIYVPPEAPYKKFTLNDFYVKSAIGWFIFGMHKDKREEVVSGGIESVRAILDSLILEKDIKHIRRLGINLDRKELEKVYFNSENLNRYLDLLKNDGPYDNDTINLVYEFMNYSEWNS